MTTTNHDPAEEIADLRATVNMLLQANERLQHDRDKWRARAEAALANARPLPHFLDIAYTRNDA